MSNLPGYKDQAAFDNLTVSDWYPEPATDSSETETGKAPGSYKCVLAAEGSGEGNLCYLEMEGAGHVASRNKPREASLMVSKWMRDLRV